MLELQSALAGTVGHRLDAAVIFVSRAVEHDARDPRFLGAGRELLPDLARLLDLLPLELRAGDRHQRTRRLVVDQLRVDVLQRAEHDETRTLGRALHLLADAEMAAIPLLGTRLRNCHLGHYLPPALPAFRRICSPAYLIPFPLYGSGGRRLRSSAATWPTISLFAPSMTIDVGVGAVSLMPAGARYSTGCEKPRASCSP